MVEAHPKDDKPAKSPAKIAKPAHDEDAPESAAAPTAAKQRVLATALSRAIVISTVIGSLVMMTGNLFSARYELVRGSNTDNNFVYRLDRLTGALRFCGQQQCSEINVMGASK